MNKTTMRAWTLILLAIGLGGFVSVQAGDLEPPPGPPAPTMVTLQEIFDGGGVAATGQTGCWDASGFPISCVGTGQDGEYQSGVSVSPRFTDNLDGTVKDNLTGLIWLKNANCFGPRDWTTALADANTLADGSCGLIDGSAAGDWRLPNLRELQSLLDYQRINPVLPVGHPFSGWQVLFYWSSTTIVDNPSFAWRVYFWNGFSDTAAKTSANVVWPVRDKQ